MQMRMRWYDRQVKAAEKIPLIDRGKVRSQPGT